MTAARTILAFAVLSALPGVALAQRNGDVSGGFDNQPTTGEVRSREKAAGVEPPPGVQQQQTGAVANIYKNLMGKERNSGMTGAPADPNAGTAPAATPR